MEKKYGVYICKGCGIKDAMDVEKVAGAAKKLQNTKFHDVLCSPEGVQLIKDDMAKEGVNTIIIAACSPRIKYEEFDLPGALVERVNIREFVAWTMEPNTDETNDAAYDYISHGHCEGAEVRTAGAEHPAGPEQDDPRDRRWHRRHVRGALRCGRGREGRSR